MTFQTHCTLYPSYLTGKITSQETHGPQTSHGNYRCLIGINNTQPRAKKHIKLKRPRCLRGQMQQQPLHMLNKLFKRNSNGPPCFNEDNHLIGTRTGDGSHSTNQQPNTSSRDEHHYLRNRDPYRDVYTEFFIKRNWGFGPGSNLGSICSIAKLQHLVSW